ncbi:MAG TPA: polysaccharide biosynthesis/export family protein [Myxococcaceae bacterium]|nr:polysaccharide biosynthesis/export family protein [Myxococcaceae bacterium]
MKHSIAYASLAGLMLVWSAAATLPVFAQARRAEDGRATAPDVYRIGPEDVLTISVWKNDSLTRSVPVRPDGKISLPLLNDVQAAGLSAQELRDVLTQKLGAYMPNPEVSVIVTNINSFKVSLIGEINRPGRLELRSWTTVLDALALAGGFTQFASRSKIVILQPDGKGMKRIPFNYNKALDGEQENFYLRNGDIILVP